MKRYFYTAIIAATLSCMACITAVAGVPSGYYSSLNGKSGIALKNAIYEVIRPHTKLTYSSLWNHFPSTDVYPEPVNGKSLVWDMYSDNYNIQKYYYPNGTSGLNREHSFPKSWWGGAEVEAYTDINHLYPSDGTANTAKSNYPLGEVLTASFNNGVCKVGSPKSGMGGGCQNVFEPADEYKGDFARTYFYMATCYQDYTWKYTYMLSNSSDLTLSSWAYTMLLDWARKDPVSQKEIDRNEAVFKVQNNRNPFIDNPGLEEYIWGNKMGQVYNGDSEVTGDPELLYPVPGSTIDFGEIALGKTVSIEVVVKAQNLTNSLKFKIYGTNSDQWSNLTVNEITQSVASKGFSVKLTYQPNALGTHAARLLFYDGGLPETGVGVALSGECLQAPTLSTITATDAINITSEGFTATWYLPNETIDSYNVNHCVYDNNTLIVDETVNVTNDDLDPESAYGEYYFTNSQEGLTHTYKVQSVRLGCTSEWSNTITLTPSGISNVTVAMPIEITSYEGGVLVRCSQKHTSFKAYNMQGRLVATVPSVDNGDFVELPVGVYIITTDQNPVPVKATVR
ncbi:MAG: endonuclease [Muribaculaceae bacterium]